MAFSDPRYLCFLAAVAIVLIILPAGRLRLGFVAGANLLFAMGLGATSVVLPVVGLLAFVGGIALAMTADGRARVALFIGFMLVVLAPLLFYKYWGVLPGTAGWSIILPVGISFYSFMAIGYLIDIYIDRDKVQNSPLNFAVFLSFFPHITAGPIGRASAFFQQLPGLGRFDRATAVRGLRTILLGLFMKVVIADTLAPHVDRIYSDPYAFGAIDHALATIYFSFQVYADFAGYSLIAVGSARLLGIELMKNFDTPYLSQSLPEYWRRWHISLSSWFRDYVFVPVQFRYRRNGKWGLVGALIATFTLVGVWHGAGPQYAIFGFVHGLLVSASTLTFAKRTKFWRGLGMPMQVLAILRAINTFLIITSTFVLFRAATIADGLHIYKSLLTLDAGERSVSLQPLLACALLILGDLVSTRLDTDRMPGFVRWALYHCAALAVLGLMFLHAQQGSSYASQFIYFKF